MFKKFLSIIEHMKGQIFTNLNKDEANSIISKYFNNNNDMNVFIDNNKEKVNKILSYLLYKNIISKEDILRIKKNYMSY